MEADEWYIGKTFLLPEHTLNNPTQLPEGNLRAYWKYSYDLFQSGKSFTFKKISTHDANAYSNSDKPKEDMSKKGEIGRAHV